MERKKGLENPLEQLERGRILLSRKYKLDRIDGGGGVLSMSCTILKGINMVMSSITKSSNQAGHGHK